MSHARVRIGLKVFELIFKKLTSRFTTLKSDFHKWTTVIFDGSTDTTPDKQSNRDKFCKSKCSREESTFSMLKIVILISKLTRLILDFNYGSSQDKGTGERTLMTKLLAQFNRNKAIRFELRTSSYRKGTGNIKMSCESKNNRV